MTRDLVLTAKREGLPFEISMADGKAYRVDDAEQIMVGKTAAIVMDKKDCPHILPLITMTGISYLKPKGA